MSPHCNFKRVMLEWNIISIFCNRTYRKCQHRVAASYIFIVEWVQLLFLFCVSSLFSKLFVDKLSILFILLMFKNIFFPFTFKISIDPISLSKTMRFLNVAFKNQTTSWSNHKMNSLYIDFFHIDLSIPCCLHHFSDSFHSPL